MRMVVMSDTHMPRKASSLPARLVTELEKTDMIIHAGDWQTMELYHQLKHYAPLIGVTGNVDSPELKTKLNSREIYEAGGHRIGIIHGHGKGQTTEKRAIAAFADERVDWIIFGHSHIPVMKEVNGIEIFNPGSPTDKRRQKQYSFGLMTITDKITAEHIFFSDKA